MKKALALVIVLILFVSVSPAAYDIDKIEAARKNLIKEISEKNHTKALSILDSIKALDPRIYKINNFPFLEAYLKAKDSKREEAERLYLGLLREDTVLKDYILFELSGLTQGKKQKAAVKHLKVLISDYPKSSLYLKALERLADLYFNMGDFPNARKQFNLLSRKSRAKRRTAKLKIAEIYEREGNLKTAAGNYYSLLYSSRSDTALKALENLESLEKRQGKLYYSSLYSYKQRAMTAFSNRSYSLAVKYFLKIYRSNAKKNPYNAEAIYYLARTYERSGKHDQAIVYYKKLINAYPRGRWERRGLYHLARVYFIGGSNTAAVDTLKYLVRKHPGGSHTLSGYFLLFQNAIASSDFKSALVYASKAEKKYKYTRITRKIILEKAMIFYQQKRHSEALGLINDLLKYRRNSTAFKAELRFWRAKIYEAQGLDEKSQDEFLYIIQKYPNDFYRYLARDRLRVYYTGRKRPFFKSELEKGNKALSAAKFDEAHRRFALVMSISPYYDIVEEAKEKIRFILSRNKTKRKALTIQAYPARPLLLSPAGKGKNSRHFLLSSEFAFLGLYEHAAEEFRRYRANDYRDMDKLYTLASYYTRAGNPHKALYWGESLIRQAGRDIDYHLLPQGLKKILYPRDFEEIVESLAKERKIDKYFVLALIREESKFLPDAKSAAAARGLMQFIPSTARDIAAELGLAGFELDDLYRPEVNINLGTRYLANLMTEFENNPLYVLSAYNSGERNTERWKKRCSSEEPEEFIGRIGYTETRNYVKRVMASFRAYHTINSPGQ